MSVVVRARVTGVVAGKGSSEPSQTQVQLDVSASDGTWSHQFDGSICWALPTTGGSINAFNDTIIAAVIAYAEASTPGQAYGWSINRNDVFISGLFQRA